MRQFVQFVREFIEREDGPTAVEYAVMLSLIIVVCLVAINAVGTSASAKFNQVATSISSGS